MHLEASAVASGWVGSAVVPRARAPYTSLAYRAEPTTCSCLDGRLRFAAEPYQDCLDAAADETDPYLAGLGLGDLSAEVCRTTLIDSACSRRSSRT